MRAHLSRWRWKALGVVAAGSAAVLAAALAAAPATAAPLNSSASSPAYGRTVVVNVNGKTFHVQLNKPSGIAWMRGHYRNLASSPAADNLATVYPPTTSTTGLNYGGGPVQTAPVIYLDFWGSQWNSDGNGVQNYMQSFFSGLGTSGDTWSTINSQYTDSSGAGPTFNGAVLGGTWVDDSAPAPSNAQQADIAAEADNAAAHFGVSGPNVNVYVMSPSGTQPDGFPNAGFCAWHNWDGTVAYTNMPYVLDAGTSCGANSVQNQLDGFSIVGGHEYAEAISDPEPASGWVDSNGQENGDLCAWNNDQTVAFSTGTFAMQPIYSNAANGCVFSSQ